MTTAFVTPSALAQDRARRRLVVVAAVLCLLGLTAPAAQAHASLVSTDPAEGAVLAEAPERVTLRFNESVTLAPGSTRLYDARGTEFATDADAVDEVVTVTPGEAMENGTYVLTYRVVSADSHPIAGSLSFSVGAPSPTVVAPQDIAVDSDPAVTAVHGAVQGAAYLALLLAAGLAVFLVVLLPPAPGLAPLRRRLRRVVQVATVVAAAGVVLLVPVGILYQQGLGLAGLGTSSPWTAYNSFDGTLAGLVVLGLGTVAWWLRDAPPGVDDRGVVLSCIGIALAAPTLVGHTRGYGPGWLVVTADIVHVAAAAVWFGGLVGLALALPMLVDRHRLAALTVTRFSVVAARLLAVVAASGAVLGWRVLGSWSGLVTTAYGVVLLCKVAVVAVVVAVAAWNRYRLLPAVLAAAGDGRRLEAGRRLRTAVRSEAAGLAVVLLLTGFLVNQVPREQASAADRQQEPQTATAVAEQVRVVARVEPGAVGRNTLTVQLQDLDGEPLEPYAAPRISVRSAEVGLDTDRVRAVRRGTYETRVVIPTPGWWKVQVSVRTDEFTNPVLTLEVEVG